MAITKLMHFKESPNIPHTHLKNAIDYILDVKHDGAKTEYGQLAGGNSGTGHEEILDHFLETKQAFGKFHGRQGYHFVISFAPGETDKDTAFALVQEFCEAYLGDKYDYVFAIHTDTKHLHGHIVFNSVGWDGCKYHYKKGDWEKDIQPITDRICTKHGLNPLTYEKERTGVSYASWAAKKNGKLNWTHIIRADVDYAIQKASTMEAFEELLGRMNYHIRQGYSKKHQSQYLTFYFMDQKGKVHARRSYKMGTGYSPKEIAKRIKDKEGPRHYEELMQELKKQGSGYLNQMVYKGSRTYRRLYQAVSYYKLPNPFAVPANQVRMDMLHIDKLLEECRYIKEKQIQNMAQLKKREERLDTCLHTCSQRRKTLLSIQETFVPQQQEAINQYQDLQRQYTRAVEGKQDMAAEQLQDLLDQMESGFPEGFWGMHMELDAIQKEIAALRREKRLIERIKQNETPIEGFHMGHKPIQI